MSSSTTHDLAVPLRHSESTLDQYEQQPRFFVIHPSILRGYVALLGWLHPAPAATNKCRFYLVKTVSFLKSDT